MDLKTIPGAMRNVWRRTPSVGSQIWGVGRESRSMHFRNRFRNLRYTSGAVAYWPPHPSEADLEHLVTQGWFESDYSRQFTDLAQRTPLLVAG